MRRTKGLPSAPSQIGLHPTGYFRSQDPFQNGTVILEAYSAPDRTHKGKRNNTVSNSQTQDLVALGVGVLA